MRGKTAFNDKVYAPLPLTRRREGHVLHHVGHVLGQIWHNTSHEKEEVDDQVQPEGDIAQRWNVRISHIGKRDCIVIGSIVQALAQLPVEFISGGLVKSIRHGKGQVARVGGKEER